MPSASSNRLPFSVLCGFVGVGKTTHLNQAAGGRVVVLVARSAFAAAPHREMAELAARAAARPGIGRADFTFVEQGTPSLRERLVALKDEGVAEIVLLPLMLPLEPGFRNWLPRILRRWQDEIAGPWPRVSVAAGPAASPELESLILSLLAEQGIEDVPAPDAPVPLEGSLVPAQKRRVLICAGRAGFPGGHLVWRRHRNRHRPHRRTPSRCRHPGGGTRLSPHRQEAEAAQRGQGIRSNRRMT